MSNLLFKIQELKRELGNYNKEVTAEINFSLEKDCLIFKLDLIKLYSNYGFSYKEVIELSQLSKPVSLALIEQKEDYDFDLDCDVIEDFEYDRIEYNEEDIIHECKLSQEELELLKLKEVYTYGKITITYINNNVYADYNCYDELKPLHYKSIVYNFKELTNFYNKLLELCDNKERINYLSNQVKDYFSSLKEDSSKFNNHFKHFKKGAINVDEKYFIYFRDYGNVFYHGVYHEGYDFAWNSYPIKTKFNLNVIHHYLDKSWRPPGKVNDLENLTGMAVRVINESFIQADLKQFMKYYVFKNIKEDIYDINFSLTYNRGKAFKILYQDSRYYILNKHEDVIGQFSFDSVGVRLNDYFNVLLDNINFIIYKMTS